VSGTTLPQTGSPQTPDVRALRDAGHHYIDTRGWRVLLERAGSDGI